MTRSHRDQQSTNDNTPDEHEASLTTVLQSPEGRGDLTLLLAKITECMRQTIADAFDPGQTGQEADRFADAATADGQDSANANLDPGRQVDVEAEERRRTEEAKRAKELSAPAMMGLRDAALAHFDDWRDAVLQRVGEVVNSRAAAGEQTKRATAPSRPTSPDSPACENRDANVTRAMRDVFPPVETPLARLTEDKRALILHSLILLLLSLEHYSAHSRVLLLYVTSSLRLGVDVLTEDENNISRALLTAVDGISADEETRDKAKANASTRIWKVGLASVAGAALIGVTGGLAAPLLAAGVGSVMGGLGLGATAAAGYLGTLAGSSVLVGGLFGAYGGRMTGHMMDKYARDVEDFGFLPIRDSHPPRKIEEYRRLRVAIGISGWLTDEDEVVEPWAVIAPSVEGFALRWELESLLKLGNSLTTLAKSAAWSVAKTEIIKRTVFSALGAGLWPLGLMKLARVIDNPFSVAKARSDKAGEVLADALIHKAQGERPITLMGYSLGARVIYACLMTLADRKAFGLVESVVLLGAPVPSTAADWRKIRSVVSGRVVNVYSANDYILAFLYRTSSIQYGIAGLQEIVGVKGVQNVDVSEMVGGHGVYRYLTGTILKEIGFDDIREEEVRREERELEEKEAREYDSRMEKGETKSDTSKGGEDVNEVEINGIVEQEAEKRTKRA